MTSATDDTFVRAVCAKLGLAPFVRTLELRQLADILFDACGTRSLRDVAHVQALLASSPIAALADVSSLTNAETSRLFEILMRNGGKLSP